MAYEPRGEGRGGGQGEGDRDGTAFRARGRSKCMFPTLTGPGASWSTEASFLANGLSMFPKLMGNYLR